MQDENEMVKAQMVDGVYLMAVARKKTPNCSVRSIDAYLLSNVSNQIGVLVHMLKCNERVA